MISLLLLNGLFHVAVSSSGNSGNKLLTTSLSRELIIRPPSISISKVTHKAHRKDSEH
jgi:hypothetical protein